MRGSDDKRLTDAEYWILLSLDDAEPLPDLVSRIVEVKPRSRIPWRRWEAREIRPTLGVDDASVALADLVAAALVEVRQVRRDELDNPEQVPVELGDGRTVMGSPHPFDLGRALSHDDVLTVVGEPRNWHRSTENEFEYWVATTEAGEAAYRESHDQRERSTS